MSLSFPSYRKLKDNLGQNDSFAELTELALRSFLKLSQTSNITVREFIRKQSNEHGVIVDVGNLDSLSNFVAINQIVNAYNSFEVFFGDFIEDYNRYNGCDPKWTYSSTKIDGKTLSKFDQILNKVGDNNIDQNHINAFNYYKKCRDKASHPSKVSHESLENLRSNISVDIKKPPKQKYFRIDKIPNSYNDLDFDDFIMFTKLCKHLAKKVCLNGFPTNYIALVKGLNLKRFNKHPELEKRKFSIKLELVREFGMSDDEVNYRINEILKNM